MSTYSTYVQYCRYVLNVYCTYSYSITNKYSIYVAKTDTHMYCTAVLLSMNLLNCMYTLMPGKIIKY